MARQTATPAENGARRLFREAGFYQVEAVPWIRQRDGEFMAVVCYPAEDAANVVRMVSYPALGLEVQRIHIGTDKYGPPPARVYLRWAE